MLLIVTTQCFGGGENMNCRSRCSIWRDDFVPKCPDFSCFVLFIVLRVLKKKMDWREKPNGRGRKKAGRGYKQQCRIFVFVRSSVGFRTDLPKQHRQVATFAERFISLFMHAPSNHYIKIFL